MDLTQSWAVLRAGRRARAERAMNAVRAHLVRRDASSCCCWRHRSIEPRTIPGYIKGYLPGVRENGGQSHARSGLGGAWGWRTSGMGDEAMELFRSDRTGSTTCARPRRRSGVGAEPYTVAADMYTHPMHVGRGGWTWYTGSAGWMYQAAIPALLGLPAAAVAARSA